MGVVIAIFFVARRALHLRPPARRRSAFFTRPFYDPATFTHRRGAGRHFHRGAHLYRLRRHLHAVGGGRESAPQHPAGHGADLRGDRHSLRRRKFTRRNLLWPASQPFPDETTAFVYAAGRAWAPLLRHRRLHPGGGEFRLRHGRAARRRAPAVRHGAQQRPAEIVLRRDRAEAPHPAQQRACSSASSRWSAPSSWTSTSAREMLNFGALIAFMGVNAAALVRYYVREKEEEAART